jgi:AmiR/NasT family two-component response regulator
MDVRGRPRAVETLRRSLAELAEKNRQLETALHSRIVIEQANGVLSERFDLGVEEAFELLRQSARSDRSNIHQLAREVVASRDTPEAIRRTLSRDARWRAVPVP